VVTIYKFTLKTAGLNCGCWGKQVVGNGAVIMRRCPRMPHYASRPIHLFVCYRIYRRPLVLTHWWL